MAGRAMERAGRARPSRREALMAAALAASVAVGEEAQAMPQAEREVRMELMRPGELEAAGRAFPAVYVPFGLIEWHGRHLPLGCDALKAHGILVACARQAGGVVYPPVYFHDGFGRARMVPVLTRLFEGLKRTGFRVILGVSGHNVREQIAMIEEALAPVTADGTVAGAGLWEVSLSQGPECNTDHAAAWETSDMMALHPDRVDLAALGAGPLAPDMKPPDGIGGLDPRAHASANRGRRCIELAAAAIGRKARELLESLPPERRALGIEAIAPGKWWLI